MCTDPNTAKQIAEIKAEIRILEERVQDLEKAVHGDGSKEKGIIPRLTSIETYLKIILGSVSLFGTVGIPAIVKYLLKG